MSGITTGIGLFSGIDTGTLIAQLLAIEARPRELAQRRVFSLQAQQAAYLDINTRLTALQSAARSFRTSSTFQSKRVTSDNPDVLTGTADTSAQAGTYQFLVDRLVSSQQLLSQGFADRDTSVVGATQFTFEPTVARLDRDTALADLNGQLGVKRGTIVISDDAGNTATIDLSRAVTATDVLDAINTNGTVDVEARVEGGHFVIDYSGPGTGITVANGTGYTTADSLGIATSALTNQVTGTDVYHLVDSSPLSLINDGNGVEINKQISTSNFDFTITVGSTAVNVNLGDVYSDITEPPDETVVTTVGGVLDRINQALADEGLDSEVSAQLTSDGSAIEIVDTLGGRNITITENGSTTAADLGFQVGTPVQDTVTGTRILASINSTLSRNLNGGAGVGGSGTIKITDRAGVNYTVTLSSMRASIEEIMRDIEDQVAGQGGDIEMSLNEEGTGLKITDNSGGTLNLIVETGVTSGSLGISTGTGGVAADSFEGTNINHRYILGRTRLDSMRDGRGVGTGTFEITDSLGAVGLLTIDENTETIDDLIDKFNNLALRAKMRVNAEGDGLEVYEEIPGGGSAGAVEMSIRDTSGSVAKNLNIAGTAPGTDSENLIDGSFEQIVTFDSDATLDDIVNTINSSGVGVTATVINDGTGSKPYRLSIVSNTTGESGRFIVDTFGLEMGFDTLDDGEDARVFFGGGDPATAVLLTSSTNTVDNIIQGLTLDLVNTSDTPVTVSVTRNTSSIESDINAFVDAFNDAISRIDHQTRYDVETEIRGPLLGDGTLLGLRSALFNTALGEVQGVSGTYTRLSQVGVTVGEGGRLSFDQNAFRAALDNDPEAVEAIFAEYGLLPQEPVEVSPGIFVNNPERRDEFDSLGVVGQIEQLMKTYVDPIDGVLTNRNDALDSQISLQNTRIEDFTARLAVRRQVLERQFLAMEQAIAQLSVQQSALSQLTQLG